MKILFTSVGRRVELMQAFREAANQLKVDLQIYGADMSDSAPALYFCNRTVLVPRISALDYVPTLLEVCKKEKIDLLIPTIDTDLLILAQNKEAFKEVGTTVLISDPERISICRDKRKTYQFFKSVGVEAPKTFDDYQMYDGGYPAFIKPKDGSSSIHAYRVDHEEELEELSKKVPDYIIQPYVEGVEYTVDAFCDFEGNPIYITPRIRLAVRSGEVLKTRIVQDACILSEMEKILTHFKPCGPITVQLIRDKKTNKDYFIEINPRFGGGAPLSMKAGANAAESILRLLKGECLDYVEAAAAEGAEYSRFDQCVCTSAENGIFDIKGVIFDLDDTLYSEKQYVRSGFKKIAEYLGQPEAEEKLWNHFLAGHAAIDAYLSETDQQDKKENCLSIYREQMPEITLYEGVIEIFQMLKARGIKIGIITDGRPEGQRNKLRALNLDAWAEDILITDELGGVQFRKPNDISFRIMQNRWQLPYREMIYIGDNPGKDFDAPRQLGMQYLYFRNKDGLYFERYTTNEMLVAVENIADLKMYLKNDR